MKYDKFQKIIDTMNKVGYDFKSEYQWTLNNVKKRQQGCSFTFEEHLSTLVYAQLSNQRPWKPIADNKDKLNDLFHNFDVEYLKAVNAESLANSIMQLKCGNRQIRKQMLSLKDNISTLETIVHDYGSIDNYYNSTSTYDIVKSMSSGKYKMKQMGIPLVSEYLKGMGVDLVKPDVHVCRILGRLGYTKHSPGRIDEVFKVCHEIAQEFNLFDMEVDSILWQFCADGYFQQCTDNPNCNNCLVKNCLK